MYDHQHTLEMKEEEAEYQHQHARISHGVGSDLHDANYVRATNNENNKIWVGANTSTMRSPSSWDMYVLSPPRKERYMMRIAKTKNTWWWNDPERKRKRRVSKYKFYAAEGKIKRSLKRGFRWLKIKCINIIIDDV